MRDKKKKVKSAQWARRKNETKAKLTLRSINARTVLRSSVDPLPIVPSSSRCRVELDSLLVGGEVEGNSRLFRGEGSDGRRGRPEGDEIEKDEGQERKSGAAKSHEMRTRA